MNNIIKFFMKLTIHNFLEHLFYTFCALILLYILDSAIIYALLKCSKKSKIFNDAYSKSKIRFKLSSNYPDFQYTTIVYDKKLNRFFLRFCRNCSECKLTEGKCTKSWCKYIKPKIIVHNKIIWYLIWYSFLISIIPSKCINQQKFIEIEFKSKTIFDKIFDNIYANIYNQQNAN